MKRYAIWIIPLICLLIFSFNCTALAPERFTGFWYSSTDAKLYHFQDGIIEQILPCTTPYIDGAYCFTRNTITLYVTGIDDINNVKTLYWVSETDGDTLCADPKADTVYFSRTQKQK